MSAAQDAYIEAQRRIAEAKQDGRPILSLQDESLQALEHLPPEIAELDKVRYLRLVAPNITDISPLAGMSGITILDIINTQITELTPLAGMTGLRTLNIYSAQITDLTPITDLSGIQDLYFGHTQINDLTAIAGLTGITTLSFENTLITDLKPIAEMKGVTTLNINSNQITDLTPISGMTRITTLVINNTQITSLAPIAGLTGITELSAGNTLITDLSPISEMTGITNLYLDTTQVTDLTPIAEMTGMTTLYLNGTQITDLTPIARMKAITALSLNNTQITDLTPIAGMTEVKSLFLNYTEITDLRPVMDMRLLVDSPELFGLAFKGCAAARLDARIAEISEIEDNSDRAATLFEYLKDWVPPEEVVPETDPFLAIELIEGKFEIAASLPSEAERDERLKQILHDRLRPKAKELAQLAGNQFPRLAARARALVGQVDRPFEQLDMLLLHLEIGDLSVWLAANAEDYEPFPPGLSAVLQEVVGVGPGLTLDNPIVELLLERERRAKLDPMTSEVKAAHDAFSRRVASAEDAIGERLRQLESTVGELEPSKSTAVQTSVHRNMLIKIGRLAMWVAGGLALDVVGNGLWQFVYESRDIIQPLLASYGAGFTNWFLAAIGQMSEVMAVAANSEIRPIRKRRDQQ